MTDRDDFLVRVIDDDEAVRESLEALLAVSGYRVVAYDSAEAYLEGTDRTGGCLVIDIHMPGMSGLELMQRLAGHQPPMPVVVLTASRDERLRERVLALGARAFLMKPVPEQALFAALQAVRTGG